MPLTLSGFMNYAEQNAHACASMLTKLGEPPTDLKTIVFATMPTDQVDRLIEIIEASEPQHAAPLIEILRHLQLHQAQLLSTEIWLLGRYAAFIIGAHNIHSHIADAAEIIAMCGKLLDFARGAEDSPPCTRCRR